MRKGGPGRGCWSECAMRWRLASSRNPVSRSTHGWFQAPHQRGPEEQELGSGAVLGQRPLHRPKYDRHAVQRRTAWDGSTLLETTAADNLAREQADGVR